MARKTKAQIRRENADVKAGTIKVGRAGNKYNKWDPKTAKWIPVAAARTGKGSGQKPTVASKKMTGIPAKPAPKAKATTSGTVSSAIASSKPMTAKQKAMAKTGGFVRGRGNGAPADRNRVANARSQNTTHAGRNAAAIAGLTVGALAGGAGLAARGGVAGARAIGAAASRRALPSGSRTAAVSGGKPAAARVTVERVGAGTRGTTVRPTGAKPTPRRAITSTAETGAVKGPARPTAGQARYAANERTAYDRRMAGNVTTKGVSRVTGGSLSGGKPSTYGPGSLTPAQKAAITRYKKASAASRAKKK
jgi:hypothetical protein